MSQKMGVMGGGGDLQQIYIYAYAPFSFENSIVLVQILGCLHNVAGFAVATRNDEDIIAGASLTA